MHIQITPHNPYWKLTYEKEEQRILAALKLVGIRTKIAHIGSTAVPGLAAKPTIDILLGLATETDLDTTIAVFQKLGYVYVSKYNDTMPFRRFFIKIKPVSPLEKWDKKEIGVNDLMPLRQHYLRNFHVHIVHENTPFYHQHLAFRNHLRANAADRQAYEALKLHLAGLDWESESDYAKAKAEFINNVLM